MSEAAPAKKTFRERMDVLSELVEQLESGDLSLEDSLVRFEQGKALQRDLLLELAGYEKRLEKLLDEEEKGGRSTNPGDPR